MTVRAITIISVTRISPYGIELRRRSDFLPGGAVGRVGSVRKPQRIENVVVAVDLGFIEDAHRRNVSLLFRRHRCACNIDATAAG